MLKAFFPNVPTMALKATAPPHLLRDLKQSLRLKNNCKIVARNPNRVNIYLDKKVRLSNHHGNESYDRILEPIANELAIQRENYPMTIIYLKLKCCGYAYGLFERILTVCWRFIRTHCKTVCTVSCPPNQSHEERHNIRNKERTIEGEGAICKIGTWHRG